MTVSTATLVLINRSSFKAPAMLINSFQLNSQTNLSVIVFFKAQMKKFRKLVPSNLSKCIYWNIVKNN